MVYQSERSQFPVASVSAVLAARAMPKLAPAEATVFRPHQPPATQLKASNSNDKLREVLEAQRRQIADDVIGAHATVRSPFGVRAVSYADYVTSGRALQSIEDFLRRHVLPLYGSTHTTTSATGAKTARLREEARRIIANAVNADADADCVLFTGSGSTGAIHKLMAALGLGKAPQPADSRPVVFVGPFAHHSNLLPWRESGADVVSIPEDDAGRVDVATLKRRLLQFRRRPLKIGSFSAASSLTGLLTDVDAVTAVLHHHGALALWDYAVCAPSVAIDMNPEGKGPVSLHKDAVFLSGHRFIGGVGSPGVLVVKKKLLANAAPTAPGGGSTLFVTDKAHQYVGDVTEREECGTPDIVGSIRLGLAIQLKQRVGAASIMEVERGHAQQVRSSLRQNPAVVLLGRDEVAGHALPVFSFLVRFGDRFLHHNFVCALLNDLFGVQASGGSHSADPHAARLLGITSDDTLALGQAVSAETEVLKPGCSRLSFPFFVDDAQIEYVLAAVHFVASHGWKFLPLYAFDCKTGAWRHRKRAAAVSSASDLQLSQFALGEYLRSDEAPAPAPLPLPASLATWEVATHRKENLALAHKIAGRLTRRMLDTCRAEALRPALERLRWFAYSRDALALLQSGERPLLTAKVHGPCQPHRYASASASGSSEDA